MRYFQNIVDFVDENLLVFAIIFAAAAAVEFIVFLVRYANTGGNFVKNFESRKLFTAIVTNIFILLCLYVIVCLAVGFVNCLRDQSWTFWQNHKTFHAEHTFYKVVLIVLAVAAGVGIFFLTLGLTPIGAILCAALGGALSWAVLYFVAFLIYFLISLLIILIKIVWFVFSGFFVSVFEFIAKYWLWILIICGVPGVIYGALRSLANYIQSFKENILQKSRSDKTADPKGV